MIPYYFDSVPIVRSYVKHDAPTGEGQCYIDATGQHWQLTMGCLQAIRATGEVRATTDGERIYPERQQ